MNGQPLQTQWRMGAGPIRSGLRRKTLVVGLGATGVSVTRFFARAGVEVAVTDSRMRPPGHQQVREEFPEVAMFLDGFDPTAFERAEQLVVSPGVPVSEPLIQQAMARGVTVMGDIEVFAAQADAPVIAVTGSNGKSTVTTLVGNMARRAGLDARMGGNLGKPALDLLEGGAADCYVLELSSFQLETTRSLHCKVACVLNVCRDHQDRYRDFADYVSAKERIFRHAKHAVIDNDDPQCHAMAGRMPSETHIVRFGERAGGEAAYGLSDHQGETWLMHGDRPLIAAGRMKLRGRHNHRNALAAWAIGDLMGLPETAMGTELRTFAGLRHRTQWVGERDGVTWINDSKGTNVGATTAALQGLPGKQVLIAGGDGKGADFTPLRPLLARHARALVLLGRDAPRIEAAVGDVVPLEHAGDLQGAVEAAARWAQPGDNVLFSPACASFDMFDNYAARGEAFIAAVRRRLA